MARNRIVVPYGFEPIETNIKGTIFFIDSFNDINPSGIEHLLQLADKREFDKIIFYPQHEETLKRMGISTYSPYHSRVKSLERFLEDNRSLVYFEVDKWEGKRKKYTPIETAVQFLMEKHRGPYFIYLTVETANKLIEYKSFEELIKKVRLMIETDGLTGVSSKFDKFESRYELVKNY